MSFDGSALTVYGGVQADLDSTRLGCQSLVIDLNPPLPLGQAPAIDSVVKAVRFRGSGSCSVQAVARTESGIVRYQRIEAPVIEASADALFASGPGSVRLLETRPTQGSSVGATPQPVEYELLQAVYEDWLRISQGPFRLSLRGQARMVQQRTADPSLKLDPDQLSPEGLTLHSDVLEVSPLSLSDGTPGATFEARSGVLVQTRSFQGHAARLAFDAVEEKLALEGDEQPALLSRGSGDQEIKAHRIAFWPKTNKVQVQPQQ
jgi:hypothetical protein